MTNTTHPLSPWVINELVAVLERIDNRINDLLDSDCAGITGDTGKDLEEMQTWIYAVFLKMTGGQN